MNYERALKKADGIAAKADDGLAIIVKVQNEAHGNGRGPECFDAVPLATYSADRQAGRYLIWHELVNPATRRPVAVGA